MQQKRKRTSNYSLDNKNLTNIPFYLNNISLQTAPIRISIIYVIIGCLWILFSDRIVNLLFPDKSVIAIISMIKGWFFVVVSGIVIYLLIYKTMQRIRTAEEKIQESYQELEASYEEIAASEEEIKQQFDELQEYNNLIVQSEDRLKRAQSLAKVGNWELELSNNLLWASEEAFRIYGLKYNSQGIQFSSAQMVVHKDDRERLTKALRLLIEEKETYDLEYKIVRLNDNAERIIHSIAEIEYNSSGQPKKVLGVIQDITESKLNKDALEHLAYYDELTDLPKRVLFIEKLNDAIKNAKAMNTKVAILFFDISNFKKISDLLGHHIGDNLLIEISRRLNASLQGNEVLAKFSGDEFAMFVENIAQRDETIVVINRIRKIFEYPFNIENQIISASTNFGVSIFPCHGDSTESLLKNANTTMYKAKEMGRNCYKFYDENLMDEYSRKIDIEKHLGMAIRENELYLCYQPQIDTKSGRIRGYEALLRWKCRELGNIQPLEFIAIAEETGLIISIGEWVLEKACETNKMWQQHYNSNTIMSVNISPIQLKQTNFTERVKQILHKTGLDPNQLELEITENILIDSFEFVDKLNELKSIGVKISLDDFGTGFSSLRYLTKLPVNTIKIDKSFVDYIQTASKEKGIIKAIISLVHEMNLEVIAEGVETREQWDYLVKLNCDNIQGYLVCKPLTQTELKNIVENGKINVQF